MTRKKEEQGSAGVAFALATFLVIFTIVTVYLFVAKIWWFPPTITQFGTQIDDQFHRTLVITGVVFVLAQLGLALARTAIGTARHRNSLAVAESTGVSWPSPRQRPVQQGVRFSKNAVIPS